MSPAWSSLSASKLTVDGSHPSLLAMSRKVAGCLLVASTHKVSATELGASNSRSVVATIDFGPEGRRLGARTPTPRIEPYGSFAGIPPRRPNMADIEHYPEFPGLDTILGDMKLEPA
ncbi:hypothetical protein [Mycobacterium sp.]|uniref:hypothetical protein n=1 Tax=Mycobacterium sp. TaxID=1785 RepID=UPI002BB9AF51|nr:hypothetical protein [Mycobacterium sp.]HTQ22814.1 hypothetical protein [Mycobacterium sp.]